MNKDLDYYMSLDYKVEVVAEKEAGGYVLHCPELPGCVTRADILEVEGEGGFALRCPELSGCITCADTLEDGFEMLEDAKKCWFTACLEDGIEIPEPSSVVFINNVGGRGIRS